ncbi:hypothetical protein ADUPG1_011151 [Aduncisulcus paluster]|uniref:Uncharacterized protein n=1 Tax=Aduncisulcus paluster TaxID=2918883 RepID=A0ABQ5JUI9_9EUKA|nr:hypothetical protein ADUPG1_011151 [Aduncisulcus paluster]
METSIPSAIVSPSQNGIVQKIQQIQAQSPEGEHMSFLDLSGKSISSKDLEYICNLLKRQTFPNLSALSLSDNSIDDDGMAYLAEAIQYTQISTIDLEKNNISGVGLKILLEAIVKKTSPISLSMRQNLINGVSGNEAISMALTLASTNHFLDLLLGEQKREKWGAVCSLDSRALKRAFSSPTSSLRRLDLSGIELNHGIEEAVGVLRITDVSRNLRVIAMGCVKNGEELEGGDSKDQEIDEEEAALGLSSASFSGPSELNDIQQIKLNEHIRGIFSEVLRGNCAILHVSVGGIVVESDEILYNQFVAALISRIDEYGSSDTKKTIDSYSPVDVSLSSSTANILAHTRQKLSAVCIGFGQTPAPCIVGMLELLSQSGALFVTECVNLEDMVEVEEDVSVALDAIFGSSEQASPADSSNGAAQMHKAQETPKREDVAVKFSGDVTNDDDATFQTPEQSTQPQHTSSLHAVPSPIQPVPSVGSSSHNHNPPSGSSSSSSSSSSSPSGGHTSTSIQMSKTPKREDVAVKFSGDVTNDDDATFQTPEQSTQPQHTSSLHAVPSPIQPVPSVGSSSHNHNPPSGSSSSSSSSSSSPSGGHTSTSIQMSSDFTHNFGGVSGEKVGRTLDEPTQQRLLLLEDTVRQLIKSRTQEHTQRQRLASRLSSTEHLVDTLRVSVSEMDTRLNKLERRLGAVEDASVNVGLASRAEDDAEGQHGFGNASGHAVDHQDDDDEYSRPVVPLSHDVTISSLGDKLSQVETTLSTLTHTLSLTQNKLDTMSHLQREKDDMGRRGVWGEGVKNYTPSLVLLPTPDDLLRELGKVRESLKEIIFEDEDDLGSTSSSLSRSRRTLSSGKGRSSDEPCTEAIAVAASLDRLEEEVSSRFSGLEQYVQSAVADSTHKQGVALEEVVKGLQGMVKKIHGEIDDELAHLRRHSASAEYVERLTGRVKRVEKQVRENARETLELLRGMSEAQE